MPVEDRLRETEEEYVTLSEQYDDLLEQHKTVHVVLSILLEEAGGRVEISDKDIVSYDLRGQIQMWRNPADETWTIQVVPYQETE